MYVMIMIKGWLHMLARRRVRGAGRSSPPPRVSRARWRGSEGPRLRTAPRSAVNISLSLRLCSKVRGDKR